MPETEQKDKMEIVNGVIIGRDQQLFLAFGGHHILDYASGRRQVTRETFENFAQNVLDRQDYVSRAGKKYVHVIFPDKQSILRDHFPVEDPVCLGELHLSRSPQIRQHVFYPSDILRAEPQDVFQRNDTHLSDYGSALAVGGLVERLTGEPQSGHIADIVRRITLERQVEGDLGGRLSPPPVANERFLAADWPVKWFHNRLVGGNNGIVDIFFSPQAIYQKRVLWFGDSFGRGCLNVLSYFFKELVFLRTGFFHPEIFDQVGPDLLVTENVERYLDDCQPDDWRPSFFMYPHLAGLQYEPSQEFARAFSAVLSFPRKPYRDFVANLSFDTAGPASRPSDRPDGAH